MSAFEGPPQSPQQLQPEDRENPAEMNLIELHEHLEAHPDVPAGVARGLSHDLGGALAVTYDKRLASANPHSRQVDSYQSRHELGTVVSWRGRV